MRLTRSESPTSSHEHRLLSLMPSLMPRLLPQLRSVMRRMPSMMPPLMLRLMPSLMPRLQQGGGHQLQSPSDGRRQY